MVSKNVLIVLYFLQSALVSKYDRARILNTDTRNHSKDL